MSDVQREQRAWWLENLLLRPNTALLLQAARTRPQKLAAVAAGFGFFSELIQKIAKRTQHVYARCRDGSLDEE